MTKTETVTVPKRTAGQCPICKHYGADCTGPHEITAAPVADQFRALLKGGLCQADVLRILGEEGDGKEYRDAIKVAREEYTTGSDHDVEIDAAPLVSRGEDGVWVSAWVWVAESDLRDTTAEG